MSRRTVYTAVAAAAIVAVTGTVTMLAGHGSGRSDPDLSLTAVTHQTTEPRWDTPPMRLDAAATRPVDEPARDWRCNRSRNARCGYLPDGDGWDIQPSGDGYEFVVYRSDGHLAAPVLRSQRWAWVDVVGSDDLDGDGSAEIVTMFSSANLTRIDVISMVPHPTVTATMTAATDPGSRPAVKIEESGVQMRPDVDQERIINVGVAMDGTWTKNRMFVGSYVPTVDQMG